MVFGRFWLNSLNGLCPCGNIAEVVGISFLVTPFMGKTILQPSCELCEIRELEEEAKKLNDESLTIDLNDKIVIKKFREKLIRLEKEVKSSFCDSDKNVKIFEIRRGLLMQNLHKFIRCINDIRKNIYFEEHYERYLDKQNVVLLRLDSMMTKLTQTYF